MPNPTIITGCALHVPAEGKAVWGDLWQYGDCFIFNANVKGFDTDWVYGDEALAITGPTDKVIVITDPRRYFDRRGVIAVDKRHTLLNPAAREYLLRNPDFIPHPNHL